MFKLSSLFTCISMTIPAFAGGKSCAPELGVAAWDHAELTPPSKYYRDLPFRFLVHALADDTRRLHQITASLRHRPDPAAPAINLERTPERVAEKGLVSTSLIDQDHVETWADAGLIREATGGHVVVAEPHDVGSPHVFGEAESPERLTEIIARLRARHATFTPERLLGETAYTYNEVILRGTSEDGRPLRLVGFFVKDDEFSAFGEDRKQRLAVRRASTRLGLPLITLKSRRPAFVDTDFQVVRDRVSKELEFLSWNNDGVRHVVRLKSGPMGPCGRYTALKSSGFEIVTSPRYRDAFVAALRARLRVDADLAAVIEAAKVDLDQLTMEIPSGGYRPARGAPPRML